MQTMGAGRTGLTASQLTTGQAVAVLRCADYARAKRFYQDTLGFEVRDEQSTTGMGRVSAGQGTAFELYENASLPAPQNTALGFEVADFDATIEDLRQRGIVFEEYDIPSMGLKTVNGVATMGQYKSAWFKDTEGNILSVNTQAKS